MNKRLLILGISYFGSAIAAENAENPSPEVYEAEPMIVEAKQKAFPKTDQATPSFEINKEAIEVINYTTVEDVFKYTPGLLILKTAVEHIPANKNQHKLDKENRVMNCD